MRTFNLTSLHTDSIVLSSQVAVVIQMQKNCVYVAYYLTLKAWGFYPVQHWGGGGGEVLSTPSVKLDPDILES